jgi:hypothetical protein
MVNKTSKSNSVEGKIQIFSDFNTLANYTKTLVLSEPVTVQEKTFTYLACRNPRLWNKNEINLVVVLSRLESTLATLTSQQNRYLASEELSTDDLKNVKAISVACAGVVTQLHTLTNRLGLSAAQLNGSAMRHETANTNSREIADLVLSGSNSPTVTTAKAASLEEARAKAKQYLESIHQ